MNLVVGGGGSTLVVVEALLQKKQSVRLLDDFQATRWEDLENRIHRWGEAIRDVRRDIWNLTWENQTTLEIYPIEPDDPYHLGKVLRDIDRVVWARAMNGKRARFLAQAERFWSEALPEIPQAFWIDPPPLAKVIFGDLPIQWIPLNQFLRDLDR